MEGATHYRTIAVNKGQVVVARSMILLSPASRNVQTAGATADLAPGARKTASQLSYCLQVPQMSGS